MVAVKYFSDHREHRYESVEEPKSQPSRIFSGIYLAIRLIMDCRRTEAHEIRTRLEFKQYDVI